MHSVALARAPGGRAPVPAQPGAARHLLPALRPRRFVVEGGVGDVRVEAKATRAYGRHGVPCWPWWPSYTSRVITYSSR